MKPSLLIALCVLLLASLACTITIPEIQIKTLKTGETQTLKINEPIPEGQSPARLEIRMGAGKLQIAGGAEGLVEGTVLYNVADWKPEIVRSNGQVILKQNRPVNAVPTEDVINEWNLKLGDTPVELEVNAGAYEGKLDFSGVPLKNLTVNDGASSATIVFDRVNPVEMDKLAYKTGASNVELTGLANANFSEMSFEGGAGSYRLDFSGQLQRDATVRIRGGVSETKIIIPQGMPCKIKISGGLNNITTDGNWSRNNNTYETEGEGARLTFEVEMGVGSLQLIQK